MALTNQALDHFLLAILDANITSNIARLGTGTGNKRIARYSMANLEQAQSALAGYDYRDLKHRIWSIGKQIKELMHKVHAKDVTSDEIRRYLSQQYANFHDAISDPPSYISKIKTLIQPPESDDGLDQWQTVGERGKVVHFD